MNMVFFQRSNGNLLILKDLIHLQSGESMSHILQGECIYVVPSFRLLNFWKGKQKAIKLSLKSKTLASFEVGTEKQILEAFSPSCPYDIHIHLSSNDEVSVGVVYLYVYWLYVRNLSVCYNIRDGEGCRWGSGTLKRVFHSNVACQCPVRIKLWILIDKCIDRLDDSYWFYSQVLGVYIFLYIAYSR